MAPVPLLISSDWIKENGFRLSVRILDASWHMASFNRDATAEYKKAHIPSAQFFDQDDPHCVDLTSPYDRMAAKPEKFAEYLGQLGITKDTHVILYDNNPTFGLFSAQRAWWMFRLFGHKKISILDGGYPRWVKEGNKVVPDVDPITATKYEVTMDPSVLKNYETIVENLKTKEFQLLDARPPPRFNGTGPEPVKGIKSGHIVGAINIPFSEMLDLDRKMLKSPQQLKEVFTKYGVSLDKPIISSCGSGVSACMLMLGAYVCGKEDIALYDGSWSEFFLRASPDLMECVPAN